ncbi:MAG: FG-GAP-like repeat-containing protein [Planctomycetota bacterium]|jgi:hypothetical protein
MRPIPRGGRSSFGPAAAIGALFAAASVSAQTDFGFAQPLVLDIGFNAFPHSIEAGDLDEDGLGDLVVSSHSNEGFVVVFFGAPGCGFVPPVHIELGGQASWAAVRDLTGDEHLDLAVSHRQGLGRVTVLTGDGSGLFPELVDYPAGRNPNLVRAADLDGDDDLDLVVLNWDSWDISILINDGGGAFTLAQNVPVNRTAGSSSSPAWAEVVDLDGDFDLDIATVGLGGHGIVHVLLNRGDGTFATAMQEAVAGIADDEVLAAVTAADFDGDGDVDLVTRAGDVNFVDRLIVLANDGAARFVTATEIQLLASLGGSPWDITSADFDGDGNIDLAWVSHILSTRAVGFLRNEGTGVPTFASPEQTIVLGGFPRGLVPADLDGDGDLDLAVANLSSHTVAVFENLMGDEVVAGAAPGFAGPSLPAPGGAERVALVECGDPEAGDCFEVHPEPACNDQACCEAVCAQIPLCCLVEWDETCVEVAFEVCEGPPACPGEGSCFEPHDGSGCDDPVCCELICLVDPFCCGGPWDQMCADEAGLLCGLPACELGDCPPTATPEPESTECWDRTNDGCNLDTPAFTAINCGEVVCGTAWTGGSRDTDWYEITVDERSELSWTVSSEFPSELFIIDGTCDERFTVAASAFGGGCQEAAVGLVVDPGTYYLFVAPGTVRAPVHNGVGCIQEGEPVNGGAYEGRYLATAACVPTCPEDINGDGTVGVQDFLKLLAAWGQSPGGPPDLDGDGVVGLGDFILLLAAWGDCP